jgi:hypothetical protein
MAQRGARTKMTRVDAVLEHRGSGAGRRLPFGHGAIAGQAIGREIE